MENLRGRGRFFRGVKIYRIRQGGNSQERSKDNFENDIHLKVKSNISCFEYCTLFKAILKSQMTLFSPSNL